MGFDYCELFFIKKKKNSVITVVLSFIFRSIRLFEELVHLEFVSNHRNS